MLCGPMPHLCPVPGLGAPVTKAGAQPLLVQPQLHAGGAGADTDGQVLARTGVLHTKATQNTQVGAVQVTAQPFYSQLHLYTCMTQLLVAS
jgi:hypothetical protein